MEKYDLKIFTENIEPEALGQIYTLLKQDAFKEAKVRIMPDVHAGAGCVIGFTGDLGDKVIPNIVGVDIGCGMLTVNLGQIDLDLKKLDDTIREKVPAGFSVHDTEKKITGIEELVCFKELKNVSRILKSVGTLGGGNHFIEIDIDKENNKYLIIHTGSRNLGKQVADIYQDKAIKYIQEKGKISNQHKIAIIKELTLSGEKHLIEEELKKVSKEYALNIPRELCYLEGQDRLNYLHDMKICQEFAIKNRKSIAEAILKGYFGINIGTYLTNSFETIHNYIDLDSNIVRKGAISAKKDEILLIPINMRDGCILGKGKGNKDWNDSAPHGAGRLMSRSKAKELINLEDYQDSMTGIFTTSVGVDTIDEAPFAYKSLQEIVDNIKDTVEIIDIIKPIYNFKASE